MPGIDELLRAEGELWRAEVDAHQPTQAAQLPTRRRLPQVWASTRGRIGIVAVAGVAAAAVVVLAVGFGTGSDNTTTSGGAPNLAFSKQVARAPSNAKLAPALAGSGTAAGPQRSGSGSGSGSRSGTAPVGSTALIVTGSMSLTVPDNAAVGTAAARATGIADGAGGRVDADDRETAGTHTATLVLRVPNAALPGVTTQLGRLGTVRSQRRQVRDVTAQVADVNSRVTSARAAIAALNRLYAKAGSVHELITVESALAARQSNLEALEARQRTLNAQTSLATLTVSIDVRSPTRTHQPPPPHHSGFVTGVKQGWHDFTRTALAIGTGLGTAVPFAVVLILVGAVGAAVVRLRTRRRHAS